MKNMKDFHDFEERFKSEYAHIQSDNKQHIIQSIVSPSKRKTKKLSISFVLCMCLLLAVVTVGAMEYTGLTFFKSNDGTMIEITNIKKEDMEPHTIGDEIRRKNEIVIKDLIKTIPDGQFLYFKDIEVYEQTGIINLMSLSNPPTITKIEELPSNITEHIHLENTLLENYHLKNGTLRFKFPENDLDQTMKIIEQLQVQAKQQNLHYGILEGELLDEINSITLYYETKNIPNWQAFEISIDTIKTRLETNENLSNYAPLSNELGIEMYYSEVDRTLRYIMQAPSQDYLITIRNPIISEQNVDVQRFIEVVKSLTGNK